MIPTLAPADSARPTRPIDWALAGWILGCLMVIALPLAVAWWHQPAGTLFTGFLSDRDQDAWSYIAKMRVGYLGGWRYENLYTETPHTGVLGVFLYYLTLGHLAKATGLSLIAMYHLARLASVALFLTGLDRFLTLLWPERGARRWAFLLILFAGGFGWLNEANAYWGDARLWPGWLFPADLVWAGLTTFGSLLLYSHYPLALWLILQCYRLAYEAEIGGKWPWAAALATFALAIHHPYDVVPVCCVLGGWFGYRAWHNGWRPLFRLSLIGLGAAIPVGYYYWVFTFHPLFSRWAKQNVCLSPRPGVYLLAFGTALALAVIGGKPRLGRDSLWRLLAMWVGVNSLLLYAPVSWQRLMMLGLPMGLMMWGARGALALAERFPIQRRALLMGIFALAVPSSTYLYQVGLTSRSYVPADEAAVAAWLESQPRDGRAVLASVVTGNHLVGLSGQRVYLGHWSETPNYHEALSETEAWYKSERTKAPWLHRRRIGWVVWGPREQSWSPAPPLAGPPVYRAGRYAIWPAPRMAGAPAPDSTP